MAEMRQVPLAEFEKLKRQYGLDDEQAMAVLKVEPISANGKWADGAKAKDGSKPKDAENTKSIDEGSKAREEFDAGETENADDTIIAEFSDVPSFNVNPQELGEGSTEFDVPEFDIGNVPSFDMAMDGIAEVEPTLAMDGEQDVMVTPEFEGGMEKPEVMDVPEFDTSNIEMNFDAPEDIGDIEFDVPNFNMGEATDDVATADTVPPVFEAGEFENIATDTMVFEAPVESRPENMVIDEDIVRTAEESIADEFIAKEERGEKTTTFAAPVMEDVGEAKAVDDDIAKATSVEETKTEDETVAEMDVEDEGLVDNEKIKAEQINKVMKDGQKKLLQEMRKNAMLQSKNAEISK